MERDCLLLGGLRARARARARDLCEMDMLTRLPSSSWRVLYIIYQIIIAL